MRYQAIELNLGKMAYQTSMVSKIRTLAQPNLPDSLYLEDVS